MMTAMSIQPSRGLKYCTHVHLAVELSLLKRKIFEIIRVVDKHYPTHRFTFLPDTYGCVDVLRSALDANLHEEKGLEFGCGHCGLEVYYGRNPHQLITNILELDFSFHTCASCASRKDYTGLSLEQIVAILRRLQEIDDFVHYQKTVIGMAYSNTYGQPAFDTVCNLHNDIQSFRDRLIQLFKTCHSQLNTLNTDNCPVNQLLAKANQNRCYLEGSFTPFQLVEPFLKAYCHALRANNRVVLDHLHEKYSNRPKLPCNRAA